MIFNRSDEPAVILTIGTNSDGDETTFVETFLDPQPPDAP